jgi:hypothetical protein
MKLPSRLHSFGSSLWSGVFTAIVAIVVVTVLIVGVAFAGAGGTTTPSTVQEGSIATTPPASPDTGVASTETTVILESQTTVEPADVPNIPDQPEVLVTQRALTLAEAILASAGARIPELAGLSVISALEYQYPEQPLVILDLAVGEKMPTVSIGIQRNISAEQFSRIPDVVGALPSERMQVAGSVDGIFEDVAGRFQALILLADGTVVNVASIGYGPQRPAPIGAAETKELAQIVATEFAPTALQDLTDGY